MSGKTIFRLRFYPLAGKTLAVPNHQQKPGMN